MTVVFAQLTMVFAGLVFLMLAGSFFARIRNPQGGKKPIALFCLVEFMIFVCAVMFLIFRNGTSESVTALLMPALGLTLIVSLPVLAIVWATQKTPQAKKKK
ncbi:MAG: hypothetical protein V1882_05310 [Candidatus Omnitrophota bacterium]